jgi:hypothetical protein
VNGHDVDARRNYSFPSTRHTSIDNTTVGKLEHDIAGLKPWLSLMHDAYKAQTGLGEGMVFIECEHRHEERSWGWRSLAEMVNVVITFIATARTCTLSFYSRGCRMAYSAAGRLPAWTQAAKIQGNQRTGMMQQKSRAISERA